MVKTITVPDMAQEHGVGQRKIYAMLRDKQIPHIRNGALSRDEAARRLGILRA
jgi:phage antirepressor YoqD-like protein